jgi:hypothetical protein
MPRRTAYQICLVVNSNLHYFRSMPDTLTLSVETEQSSNYIHRIVVQVNPLTIK